MKRFSRALAIAAPFVGVVVWFAVGTNGTFNRAASQPRPWNDESASHGRTRELPSTGPVAAPGCADESMMPIKRLRELMPHLESSLFEPARMSHT